MSTAQEENRTVSMVQEDLRQEMADRQVDSPCLGPHVVYPDEAPA